MTSNRIIYFIIAMFIAGNLLLISLHYNSRKAIDSLVNSNQLLLNQFEIGLELKTLETNVITLDSKIRGMVTTRDISFIKGFNQQIEDIQSGFKKLQNELANGGTGTDISTLNNLLNQKLTLSNEIVEAFRQKGNPSAGQIISSHRGQILTDSILQESEDIRRKRRLLVINYAKAQDMSVKKVEHSESILNILVLSIGVCFFCFVIYAIRKQNHLIKQIRMSQKELMRALHVKENFLANVSHEIRTPMNAILGFTNLLQNKQLDSESLLYVQTIQRSGESLLAIINDILDLSKIEAGMMRIESVPFSLHGLMHSIKTLFQAKAREKGIQLITHVDESIPEILDGDGTRLTQILVNLLGNAIKFTARGNVSVMVRNKGKMNNRIIAGFEIKDTGIGIEQEKLKYIFGRFQQADNAVTREYGGTGLGLSIVKDLVELQQGSIRVESEPGKGTTFYLEIPYEIHNEPLEPTKKVSFQKESESGNLQNIRILIVEDNEVNQTLLRHLFRNWKVSFEMATNGLEAIEKLKTGAFDLIIMDIQMPQMDGYTAAQQIRNVLNIKTPIIAMTAHAMAGEKEKCLSYGMNEYISKPIREEQLKKLIEQFVPPVPYVPKAEKAGASIPHIYKYIDLGYMKEVSEGDKNYEKDVTRQFIKAIPNQLNELERAWEMRDMRGLNQIAHNLKTTISVMGLNDVLDPYLDGILIGTAEEKYMKENIGNIKRICNNALPEASDYLAFITQ